jgi:hypothetical protein
MIRYIPAMVIDYGELRNKLKGNLKEFSEDIESVRKQLQHISGYFYDNNIARFSNIFGTEFKFLLYGKHLSVYDQTGGVSIYDGLIPEEDRDNFINNFLDICERWSKGDKRCDDCHTWINYQENKSHSYFAGTYCEDCWNRKWKAIEAAESYD